MNKLVIVKSDGSLPIRGGINGPITSPTSLNVKEIVALLNKFKEVYEVNPYTGEQIRLTRINCTKENFKKVVVPKTVSISEKKEELPQKKNDTVQTTDDMSKTTTEEIKPTVPTVKEQPKKEDMKRIDSDFVSNSKHKK